MVRGICYHHEPALWPEPISYAVCLADAVAKLVGRGIGPNPDAAPVSEAIEALGMRPESFGVICQLASECWAEVAARYE